ncbi:MAG: tetratricopeptide repeat protein [Bacteroidales bacterium]|jgi:tetratricopeptide (TPR) repeat protein|nr:tetratricopeptide repeat protein [Bacteroidales bacterium]
MVREKSYICVTNLVMMNCKRNIIFILACFMWISAVSQDDVRPLIEKGNSFYNKEDYRNAAVQYKHACQLDSLSFDAWYNFGNALCKMNKFILATEAYNKALKLTADKIQKANIYYNVGNIECEQKHYEKAINLYKQALLLNPKDEEIRYNLAFAQEEFRKEEEARKMLEKMNEQLKNDEKKKPTKYAEDCLRKAQELVQQFKFEDAFKLMQEGVKKDKTVELYNDFIKKLEDIITIINDNKE